MARKLVEAFGLEKDDIHSRSMGAGGEDLMLSPLARRKIPYSFECKKHARFSIYGPYEQAEVNAEGFEPVLLIEGNRKKPLAVIDFDLFLRLITEDR